MPNIGPTELIIVLVIALIILGPKKLPGAGRSLGQGLREFKDSVTASSRDGDDARPERTLAPPPEAEAARRARTASR